MSDALLQADFDQNSTNTNQSQSPGGTMTSIPVDRATRRRLVFQGPMLTWYFSTFKSSILHDIPC